MPNFEHLGQSELEASFWTLYRDFFDQAEKRRRWNIREDIPWDKSNPNLDPAIGNIMESFCAVELYLPDYHGKILPKVRISKGRTWFYANWGYEESKHSIAINDWLLRSGMRTQEQMHDLEASVFEREWNLPHDDHLGMLVYAMTQELATFLNYRNVKNKIDECGGDPALHQLLTFVSVDEKAHYKFFRDCVELYLKHDREAVLESMRSVMNNFNMPAIYDLADGRQRVANIKSLEIFTEDIYYREVYLPILESLGVTRKEMKNRIPEKKSMAAVPKV